MLELCHFQSCADNGLFSPLCTETCRSGGVNPSQPVHRINVKFVEVIFLAIGGIGILRPSGDMNCNLNNGNGNGIAPPFPFGLAIFVLIIIVVVVVIVVATLCSRSGASFGSWVSPACSAVTMT